MRYMVSYSLFDSMCGNQTFDNPADAKKYLEDHKVCWKSFSTFKYERVGVVNELVECDLDKEIEKQ